MPPTRMWQFAHLSEHWKDIKPLDRVPRAGQLSIGGLAAFHRDPDPLKSANITHILSVLLADDVPDQQKLTGYNHLHIQADDLPEENLLQHFDRSNEFIDRALSDGGSAFVHCAMGVSRSATLVCAYLMWKHGVSAREALAQLREARKHVQPNEGFSRQLEVYDKMLHAKDPTEADKVYQKWAKVNYAGRTVKL